MTDAMRSRAVFALAARASACAPEWVVWHGHTLDRKSDLRIVERGGRQHLLRDGRDLGAHGGIGVDSLTVTGDHIAYPARDGLAWRVYVDGIAEPGSWESVGVLALDERGERAYAVERGGRWLVVARGRTHGPYDGVSEVGFDARGRAIWMAVAKAGPVTNVIVDGVSSAPWREVRDVRFSPVFRYVATSDKGESYVREGEVSAPFETIVESTDDGFIAKTKGRRVVFEGGTQVGEGEAHLLAAASGHFAFARLGPGGERLVRDGAEDAATWQSVDSVSISADGRHVGWVGRRNGDAVVVVDGHEEGSYAWARAPVFAERADAFAYVASMGGGAIVRGSQARGAFDVIIEDSLVISPDGAHWAAIAGYASNRRLYVVADGRPCGSFDLDEWLAERVRLHRQDDGERSRQLARAELARCYAPRP